MRGLATTPAASVNLMRRKARRPHRTSWAFPAGNAFLASRAFPVSPEATAICRKDVKPNAHPTESGFALHPSSGFTGKRSVCGSKKANSCACGGLWRGGGTTANEGFPAGGTLALCRCILAPGHGPEFALPQCRKICLKKRITRARSKMSATGEFLRFQKTQKGVLGTREAAIYLGMSITTLRKCEKDSRVLKKTHCGRDYYGVESLRMWRAFLVNTANYRASN